MPIEPHYVLLLTEHGNNISEKVKKKVEKTLLDNSRITDGTLLMFERGEHLLDPETLLNTMRNIDCDWTLMVSKLNDAQDGYDIHYLFCTDENTMDGTFEPILKNAPGETSWERMVYAIAHPNGPEN